MLHEGCGRKYLKMTEIVFGQAWVLLFENDFNQYIKN